MHSVKPLVTVVIPAFKKPELLCLTLESVFNQTLPDAIKVIVVDDHSPDPLEKYLHKYKTRITLIRNKSNLGAWASRNIGAGRVESKYLAFLDADDIWLPDFLKTSISHLQKSKHIGSTAMPIPMFDKNYPFSQKIKKMFLLFIWDLFYRLYYYFNQGKLPRTAFYLGQISHFVFKTDAIKGIKFDRDYNFGGEDWKFMLEIMDRGSIGIINKRLVRYRYHPSSSILEPINLKNKWNSYKQLFPEIEKRGLHGVMIELLKRYIKTFEIK